MKDFSKWFIYIGLFILSVLTLALFVALIIDKTKKKEGFKEHFTAPPPPVKKCDSGYCNAFLQNSVYFRQGHRHVPGYNSVPKTTTTNDSDLCKNCPYVEYTAQTDGGSGGVVVKPNRRIDCEYAPLSGLPDCMNAWFL